jgi:hypothetical protein
MGEARALFCRKLVEAQEARDQQDVKQNNGGGRLISKAVVVNGSGNRMSWITWTQGKKGARRILEKDQASGAPLLYVSDLCIY